MTSLHVICGLAPPNPKSWQCLCIKPRIMCIQDTGSCIFVLLRAPSRVVAYKIAKVQNIHCIASSLKVLWYGSMEWNVEENFSMEWKIFSIEWKWNGRKLPEWNMEKSSSIPYHVLISTSQKYCRSAFDIEFDIHSRLRKNIDFVFYIDHAFANVINVIICLKKK